MSGGLDEGRMPKRLVLGGWLAARDWYLAGGWQTARLIGGLAAYWIGCLPASTLAKKKHGVC